jgi:hypothetical protein
LVVFEYLKSNHTELVKDYLEEKKNYETLLFHNLDIFFKEISIDRRRLVLREAKNCLKNLEGNKEFDYKFYKNYLEDIEKSLFFKRDLLYENLIKQSDITTFDNSIFDCYKSLIKQEKMPLVETKNKQYFEVKIFF